MRHGQTFAAYASGLLFGAGLVVSGMTDPANILAFLDIAGDWNPALAVVMATAIAVAMPAFVLVKKRRKTLLGEAADIANRAPVDRLLVGGSILFGVGWGLSGVCPGPGLIIAASGIPSALVFVGGVTVGTLLATAWSRRRSEPASA